MPAETAFADSIAAESVWNRMAPIQPRIQSAEQVEEAPLVDGHVMDSVWDRATWSTSFVDIEGNPERKPKQDTRFKALWDDEALYIAVELEESDLWGTITTKNAVLFWENDIEIFLDPDGDMHNYWEAEWNVLGTIWELSLDRPYRDGGPVRDPNNLEGLRWAVHADGTINQPGDADRGWTIEIAIPWAAMRAFDAPTVPPEPGSAWRFNLSRVQWPLAVDSIGSYQKRPDEREHNQVFSPIGIIDMHRPERWAWLVFDGNRLSASGKEASREHIQLLQEAQDRLMAIYYFAGHYRARTGLWPRDQSMIPAAVMGDGVSISYHRTESGYEASVPVEVFGRARRLTIDHLGHLQHRE